MCQSFDIRHARTWVQLEAALLIFWVWQVTCRDWQWDQRAVQADHRILTWARRTLEWAAIKFQRMWRRLADMLRSERVSKRRRGRAGRVWGRDLTKRSSKNALIITWRKSSYKSFLVTPSCDDSSTRTLGVTVMSCRGWMEACDEANLGLVCFSILRAFCIQKWTLPVDGSGRRCSLIGSIWASLL